MLAPHKKKNLKINIVPLIDIIFLMLVFFMLATNFDKSQEINFSIDKNLNSSKEDNKDFENITLNRHEDSLRHYRNLK